jgi:glycosyltransferase involved in cell wall biosynthesis
MKIVQWNFSRKHDPMYGVKRYEDELSSHIKRLYPDFSLEKIQRSENRYYGSIPVSWFMRPRFQVADIVHATFQTIAPAALFRKPGMFIVTVHDLIPIIYRSAIRNCSTRIQWIFTPAALKKVDHIIAISEFTKRELIRKLGINKENISVVYLGVDHSAYHPMDKDACKRKFGLRTSDKHILVVASNEKHKRMDLVMDIFNEIIKQRTDIKLIKIGYGEFLKGDRIINPGWVEESDMPLLFNAADIFLHTAEYEGFGLPILEAMACGTPAVVSNSASIPEIVGDCGTMINLSSKNCVQDFVQEILMKLDRGTDNKSVERSNHFNWEKTARETVNVYQKLLSAKRHIG